MAYQKLYYDQAQIDTIRYWQQQMQEEELGGMGYENFVEKHGPVFASQVEMMGKKLNHYNEQQGKKLVTEDNLREAVVDESKNSFWSGEQDSASASMVKGLGRGAVSAWNFTVDAGREVMDIENYGKIVDFVGNKLLPGQPLAMERWSEEMKAKALKRSGGFGFYGRAISTPGDARKYFQEDDFYEARPWLKMVRPFEGEDLGALGTAAEIVVQEIAFMGPLSFLRLAKAAKHVTHFTNVDDKNYTNILAGKGYLRPLTESETLARKTDLKAGVKPSFAETRARYRKGDLKSLERTRTQKLLGQSSKELSDRLSESLGRKVSQREARALQKLNEQYGGNADFFTTVKQLGDRSEIGWKNSLQKLAATLNPKEARKIQKLVSTGTAKGRFLFSGSAGGAYKETELMASTAAVAGGAWVGEQFNEDVVFLGEIGGGLMGPSLFKAAGNAVPDYMNALRYHFGSGDLVTKEDTLLAAAFGKTKEQLAELRTSKNERNRTQLLNMAKTMPSPRIPFVYDFATSERKKLNAYRALARQIEDLPADIQAEIAARIERAEELLGDNPDVYASLSAITGITVLETIEQSARHKDSVGKSISITLNPEQLSSVKRKMESLDGLISRLEGFKRDVVGQGDVNNTEYWTVLSNRIVKEVQHVLDDAYLFENKEIKETAGRLSQRTDDLVKEVNEAQKLKGEDIERLETVTKDDYWKSKDVDTKLVDIDEETGQMSGFSKDLQDDYNRMKINQGANIVNDGSGNNYIIFNQGVGPTNRTKEQLFDEHNNMMVSAYNTDTGRARQKYEIITGYSNNNLRADGSKFLRDLNEEILTIENELGHGIKEIHRWPTMGKNMFGFMRGGRLEGLQQIQSKSPELLDDILTDYYTKVNPDATVEDVINNRKAIMETLAGDFRETSLYDVFQELGIKPKVSLKGMVDARGEQFELARKFSVQQGGSGPMRGNYERRLAEKIHEAVDTVSNPELKEAQKYYKTNVIEKWRSGLTYSLFGRYLRKGDAQKLAKFDKFFTLDPVEARRVFDTTYINGRTSQEQSKAKELLKDSLAKYHMESPDAKKLPQEWFNSFNDVLDLERLETSTTGEALPGSPLFGRGEFKSYQQRHGDFTNARDTVERQAQNNVSVLMDLVKKASLRGHVFGKNIPLETIDRLSREQNPERFREMIMTGSDEGGYTHMVDAVVDVINRSKDTTERQQSLTALQAVLWDGIKTDIAGSTGELAFDSATSRFKSQQSLDAAVFDKLVNTHKNSLKKIYGDDGFKKMEDLNEIVQIVVGQVPHPSVSGMPKPITIPALMSRVYGIFRGVISPKYVLTELLYQDARFRRGKLLEEIATDPDAARIMADVVLYNRIKNRTIRNEFNRYWAGIGQRYMRDYSEDPIKMDVYSTNMANNIWNEDEHDYTWEEG